MIVSLNQYLKYEQEAIDNALRHHHGYELMWVGAGDHSQAKSSPICHGFTARFDHVDEPGTVLLEEDALPFSNDMLDMVVLNHYLEQKSEFVPFLREIHRTLRHDGMLMITGFNPIRQRSYSLYRKVIGKKAPKNFRSISKLRKIIEPLGFSLYRHYFYGFSDSQTAENFYRKCVPGISVGYVLLLQKRTVKLTPIKQGLTAEKIVDVASILKPSVKPVA